MMRSSSNERSNCKSVFLNRNVFLSLCIVTVCFAGTLVVQVKSQIRVLQPPALAERYRGGVIRGSTAAFGTPLWGEQLIGSLVYSPSKTGNAYCTAEDYDVAATDASDVSGSAANLGSGEGGALGDAPRLKFPSIFLLRRGKCHFVQKVKVAQDKGAAAVIVVDEEGSGRLAEEIRGVIMADDGRGQGIKIPSVLISDLEGTPLIEAVNGKLNVIVEMVWDMPNEDVVEVDSWITPAISSSLFFLKEFVPYAKVFKHKLSFKPHYWVFGLPADYTEMCVDTSGRFCSMSADWSPSVSGRRVLQESLRQLCLWHVTKTVNESLPSSGEYSEIWWNYIDGMFNNCVKVLPRPKNSAPSESPRDLLSEGCSYSVMKAVGAPSEAVKQCESERATDILIIELLNHAWSPTAIMVNGARFSGPLTANVVLRAICTGYTYTPQECVDLKKAFSDGSLNDYLGLGSSINSGVPWWIYFLSGLLVCFGISLLSLIYFYRNCFFRRLRGELRYEVFNEVRTQMKGLNHKNLANCATDGAFGVNPVPTAPSRETTASNASSNTAISAPNSSFSSANQLDGIEAASTGNAGGLKGYYPWSVSRVLPASSGVRGFDDLARSS